MRALAAKIAILLGASIVLLLAAVDSRANTSSAAPTLDQKAALAKSQAVIGKAVGEHVLTDASGRRLKMSDFRGKPLVVSFVYTGCAHVCPATTRFLRGAVKAAQDALGRDSFQVLTIGFNLPFDTPQAMKAFARQHGVDHPQWTFASPDAQTLDALLADFGFSHVATAGGFDHLLQVTIVDAQGRVQLQLYGDSFDLPLLVEPLKGLITGVPVALPDFGAWLERVKLLCTVYDPASGRYRLNYAVVIEIVVGASVLLLGLGSLALEWRRNRRARRAA